MDWNCDKSDWNWKRWHPKAKKTAFASEYTACWRLDEIVPMVVDFYNDTGCVPQLAHRRLDEDVVSHDKRGQWSRLFVVVGHLKLL